MLLVYMEILLRYIVDDESEDHADGSFAVCDQ